MKSMTATQLKRIRNESDDLLLINTLDEEDFGATQIPGAINIPQSRADFVQRVEAAVESKHQQIVTYCANQNCNSSTQGARKLEEAGFTNVYDFEAGAEGWRKAGERIAHV